MPQEDQKAYVRKVLRLYRRLPGSAARPRRADRQLAATLHRRGVSLDIVESALLLAMARRNSRPPDADPLPPVRSLHYFLPVIDELTTGSTPDGYLDYLRDVVPNRRSATGAVTSPSARRPTHPHRRASRQLRLPLDVGAGPKKDVSS